MINYSLFSLNIFLHKRNDPRARISPSVARNSSIHRNRKISTNNDRITSAARGEKKKVLFLFFLSLLAREKRSVLRRRVGRRRGGGGGIAQREQKGVAGLVEAGDLSRYPRASGRRLCIYACFAGIACFLPITRHSTWHTTPGYGTPYCLLFLSSTVVSFFKNTVASPSSSSSSSVMEEGSPRGCSKDEGRSPIEQEVEEGVAIRVCETRFVIDDDDDDDDDDGQAMFRAWIHLRVAIQKRWSCFITKFQFRNFLGVM